MASPETVDPTAEMSSAESIAYLRARGVEVDLPGERKVPHATLPGAPEFEFVFLPADAHAAVSTERAVAVAGDGLKALLAPRFATDESMDAETVAREAAATVKSMLTCGGKDPATGDPSIVASSSAARMQQAAAGGACEAYPLATASEENGYTAVRLYIDEVGALRGRPRNKRAEDLAAAVGLVGLSIHGDAYVGRSGCAGGERNGSFGVAELAHDSAWMVAARRAHHKVAEQRGLHDEDGLASGDQGTYSWSQTDDDVEVRVRAAPTGRGAAKRVAVRYGSGDALTVAFDGKQALAVPKLFARVTPDECTWTLDSGELVISLEKAEARPWASLALEGEGVDL